MKIIMLGPNYRIDLDRPVEPHHTDRDILLCVLAQLKHNEHQLEKAMTAIENLNQAVSDLTAAVTAAVADISTPHATDAQVQAAADAVVGNTARLTGALNPPAVVQPTA